MAQSFLVFDFGNNEEAAQQARHKIEGWKQGFRLGNKVQLKFERQETEPAKGGSEKAKASSAEPEETKSKRSGEQGKKAEKKAAKKAAGNAGKTEARTEEPGEKDPAQPEAPQQVRILVRLSFSDHEKLSFHRWLDRIPGEEPFKSAKPQTIRPGEPDFQKTEELFDSLS
jgi:hypothetical protein